MINRKTNTINGLPTVAIGTTPVSFVFNGSSNVRMTMRDEKSYWCGVDVGRVLGYAKPNNAINKHCLPEGIIKVNTTCGAPKRGSHTCGINYIDEGNLYRLIIRSKLPEARKFEKWVFDEVLPMIRRTGCYVPGTMNEKIRFFCNALAVGKDLLDTIQHENTVLLEDKMQLEQKNEQSQRLLMVKQDQCDNLEREKKCVERRLESQMPKVEAYNHLMNADGNYDMATAAQILNMGRRTLFDILRKHEIIKKIPRRTPYEKYRNRGLFKVYTNSRNLGGGRFKMFDQTFITPKGLEWLMKKDFIKIYM